MKDYRGERKIKNVLRSFLNQSSEKVVHFAEIRSGWEKWFQMELSYWFSRGQKQKKQEKLEQFVGSQIRADMVIPLPDSDQEYLLELKVGYNLSHMRYVFKDIKKYAKAKIEPTVHSIHFVLLYKDKTSANTFYKKFISNLLSQKKCAWYVESEDQKATCVVLSFVVDPDSQTSPSTQLHNWVTEMMRLKDFAKLENRRK